jgi:predicted RND superfamily exporter protein
MALGHPRVTLALLAAVTLGFAGGLAQLETKVGYRGFLGPHHPAIQELDSFLERFGGGLPAAAVWSCEESGLCQSVFDPVSLRMAQAVVRELEAVEGVRHVESPATTPVLVPTAEGFESRRLIEWEGSPAERAALAERARSDPLWVGRLVSEDGSVGAIVVEHASSESAAVRRVVAALENALLPHQEQGFRYHLVGPVLELMLAEEELDADFFRVVPLMAGIVLGVFVILFRSLPIALLALVTAALAPLWAMGLSGWLGWPRNAVLLPLAPVILVIASCHSIHWLARYGGHGSRHENEGLVEPQSSLLSVAREIGRPCLMTSVTTAAGFLSFLTSGVESFVRFGILAATGVGAALLITFTLLPILLLRVRPRSAPLTRASATWDAILRRIVGLAARHQAVVLLGAAGLGGVCLVGLQRLRVDVDPYELVGERSRVVQWASFVEARLRKPDSLEIELEIPDGASLHSPRVLREIERLSDFLSRVDGLGRSWSIVGALKRAKRWVQGHDGVPESLAESPQTNAQLLLLLSLQGNGVLNPWVSLDRRRVRVSVEADMQSQTHQRAMLDEVGRYLEETLPDDWTAQLNGPLWVRRALIGEIQRTQLWSFAAAGLAVFTLLGFFLDSLPWACLAMIPSILPVIVTLGTMGVVGIPLDIGGAMVAAVVLGIAVDDTIYLLSSYRDLRRRGDVPAVAIREAVLLVGPAITTTSLALTLGFLALTLSHVQSIANFGLLAGIAILGAWVADLVLLPVLILLVSKRGASPPA